MARQLWCRLPSSFSPRTGKLLEHVLIPQVKTWNPESLLSESLSKNSTSSNFLLFPPWSHILRIYSHIYFPDFCQYKLEKVYHFYCIIQSFMGYSLYYIVWGLLEMEFCFRSRSKLWSWEYVFKRSSMACKSTTSCSPNNIPYIKSANCKF